MTTYNAEQVYQWYQAELAKDKRRERRVNNFCWFMSGATTAVIILVIALYIASHVM